MIKISKAKYITKINDNYYVIFAESVEITKVKTYNYVPISQGEYEDLYNTSPK